MNDCAFVQYKLSVARYLSYPILRLFGLYKIPIIVSYDLIFSSSLAFHGSQFGLTSGKDTVGHCRHCHLPGGCVGFCSAKGL